MIKYFKNLVTETRGVDLLPTLGGPMRRSGGRKSPSGLQGQSPWWRSGGKAPRSTYI